MNNLDDEIAKAATIMSRYRMKTDDQIEVVRILLSAGVEKCLSEQERIRADKDSKVALAQKDYRGLVH